jgi:hypothetical protein
VKVIAHEDEAMNSNCVCVTNKVEIFFENVPNFIHGHAEPVFVNATCAYAMRKLVYVIEHGSMFQNAVPPEVQPIEYKDNWRPHFDWCMVMR